MPVARASVGGSPYLGVYLRVAEKGALLPPTAPEPLFRELDRLFGGSVVRSTIGGSDIVGSLLAWNSFGAAVGEGLDEREREGIESLVPVTEIPVRQNALGNNVLANDHGAVVHPVLSDEAVEALHRALRVPVVRGSVAGLGTVGMAAVATNRGVVVHPKTTESEQAVLERTLGVPAHRSTANFGVSVVGASVVANSRSLLVGSLTTAVELVHLQEGLAILE